MNKRLHPALWAVLGFSLALFVAASDPIRLGLLQTDLNGNRFAITNLGQLIVSNNAAPTIRAFGPQGPMIGDQAAMDYWTGGGSYDGLLFFAGLASNNVTGNPLSEFVMNVVDPIGSDSGFFDIFARKISSTFDMGASDAGRGMLFRAQSQASAGGAVVTLTDSASGITHVRMQTKPSSTAGYIEIVHPNGSARHWAVRSNMSTYAVGGFSSARSNRVALTAITPTGSPFNWTNTSDVNSYVFIAGGTVSDVAINGTALGGPVTTVPLQTNEWVTVTYSVDPTMNWKPF